MGTRYEVDLDVDRVSLDDADIVHGVVCKLFTNAQVPSMSDVGSIYVDVGYTTLYCELDDPETPEEFSRRVAYAIWDALGRYVRVCVDIVLAEDPPALAQDFENREYRKYLLQKKAIG